MAVLTGGDKLDAALAAIAAKLDRGGTLRVGFLEGATYPDGTSVAMVAAVQNFGSMAVGVPPRPFFSDMIAEKSPGWPAALGKILPTVGYDGEHALRLMGEGIKGQLQEAITKFEGVPLAPATEARKGFGKQLVDTGHMLNSVDYEVATGDGS